MSNVIGVETAQQLRDAVNSGATHIEVRRHIDLGDLPAERCSDGQACHLELADGTLSFTVSAHQLPNTAVTSLCALCASFGGRTSGVAALPCVAVQP